MLNHNYPLRGGFSHHCCFCALVRFTKLTLAFCVSQLHSIMGKRFQLIDSKILYGLALPALR